jgi:acyl carrier protein
MLSLENEIRALIISALFLEDIKPEDIDPEEDLFGDEGLALDSIDALELGVAIQKEYGVKIDPEDPNVRDYFRSVRSLARYVAEQRKP